MTPLLKMFEGAAVDAARAVFVIVFPAPGHWLAGCAKSDKSSSRRAWSSIERFNAVSRHVASHKAKVVRRCLAA
jgi:hypothetical protein